jgi:hypothetical protein
MDKKKHLDVVVPKYQFAPLTEEDKKLPPIQRQVFKTMEITESFTVYSVFQHLAKMEKAIADKQAEIDGLEEMKKAYMAEMAVIEGQLGIHDLEHEFALVQLAEAEAKKLETNEVK